jgi:hypothetical protein
MVIYEVTATVAAELVPGYEQFMREQHIPALLRTGCFRSAVLARSAPGRYRMRYEAEGEGELERYVAQFAEELRAEFVARFPSGIELSREVWTVVEAWSAPTVRPSDRPTT